MRQWIENTKDANLRGVTIVAASAVFYAVEHRVGDNWVTLWETRVDFGRDKNHRAGGYAFRAAASEQERIISQRIRDVETLKGFETLQEK